jgi:3-deoxy-D-manno-octulosonate 8-phosphate phosphatase (KDO 8-P phosphatase)
MELNFKQHLNNITTFIFDVDGVLTDGTLTLMPDGEQVRKMNIKDGFAIDLAIKKGYRIAVISGGKSEAVRKRLELLGVKDIYLGVHRKLDIYEDYLASNNLNISEILYMGDDIPDYETMAKVRIATCPNDAAPEIKRICIYVSGKKGGEGCVRDVIEQVLRVQGKWDDGIVV